VLLSAPKGNHQFATKLSRPLTVPAYPLTDEQAQSTQISYASDELSRLGQYIIRILEQLTGQQRLSAMYADYRERRRPPELFWADAIEALHLELELNRGLGNACPPPVRLSSSPIIPSESWTGLCLVGSFHNAVPIFKS
jgi:hypothetical protein